MTRIERWLARANRRSAPGGGDDFRGYWGGGLGAYPATGRSRDETASYKENIRTKLLSIKVPTAVGPSNECVMPLRAARCLSSLPLRGRLRVSFPLHSLVEVVFFSE
jgi:hypothetical protein